MIIEDAQAIELIKSKPPQYIKEAQKKHKTLKAHVTGKGYVELLNKVSEYENDKQEDARKKFGKSLKDVMSNILRPVDKIFSAKGSAFKIDTSEKVEKDLLERLMDFDNEMTLKNWIRSVQKSRYFYDPSGFVFFEWGEDYLKPKLYSISDVHCYEREGRGLKFVIFAPYYKYLKDGTVDKSCEYYRVVDSGSDRVYKKVGDNVSLIENGENQEIFENPWGKVPAVLNSNIPSDCGNYMDSPLDVLVELADKYLRNDSIKSIYEFLHGYPIFWMYASKEPCKICNGLGHVKGTNGVPGDECPSCHGVGHQWKKDVTTGYFLKPPQEKDEPTIAPEVAGYVQPDLETWREQRTELEWLYDAMHFSLWGTTQATRAKNETATARFLDLQPVNDRLYDFSEAFEDLHKRLAKMFCEYFYPGSIDSVTVVYGKRFIMESPDAIWEKYQTAREKGSPEFTKNHLLEQYYQSEYEHDPEMLAYSLKGIIVEPYVHQEAKELYDMGRNIDAKLYFSDWWQQQDILDVLRKTPEALKQEFELYVQGKINQISITNEE